MNNQWRWQHTAKKCGLFGCKVDIEGLFYIRQEIYLTQEGFVLPQDGFALPQEGFALPLTSIFF